MSKFHGWTRDDSSLAQTNRFPSLHVGQLPGRKGVALYESNGSVRVLAYFKDEAAALRTIELLDWLTKAKDATIPKAKNAGVGST